MLLTIVAFIVCLGLLVLVHELGHFLAAKTAGVKVLEFSIGFPPRIYTFKRKETKYSIGLLLFGGYVQMLGEEEESKDPRAYNNQSPLRRFFISIAGVVMNFLLAWILITIGFTVGMTPIATPSEMIPGKVVKAQVFIVETLADSPAAKGGLEAGDQIIELKYQDQAVRPKSLADVSNFTTAHLGNSIIIELKRDNQTLEKTVTISEDKSAPLGVSITNQSIVRVPWYKAPIVSLRESYEILKITFDFLGSFVKELFSTGHVSDQVGGPVAIFNLSGVAARAGIIAFLQFIAILSINLGLVNSLPFPSLDGSRALLTIIEKITKKRVLKENVENIVHLVGFAILILLILAITYKDIIHLIVK
ncbi:MAG: M50 family metallopeptidase [Candidatus Berkelbacteria bacterium]|nr:M50 family metallopeptidase [Candidatus Berkelbacteria bacterium]